VVGPRVTLQFYSTDAPRADTDFLGFERTGICSLLLIADKPKPESKSEYSYHRRFLQYERDLSMGVEDVEFTS